MSSKKNCYYCLSSFSKIWEALLQNPFDRSLMPNDLLKLNMSVKITHNENNLCCWQAQARSHWGIRGS